MSAMDKTLPQFIEEIGDEEAARIGGVTVRTAQSYRRRERYPRPDVAKRFVETGGVSWEGIYKPEGCAA